jgi:CheY-like chemotaxis protein
MMSVVMVVQPDAVQAEVLRRVVHDSGADLVMVASTADAIEAIGRAVPDLILLSTLLSPRDEDGLMAHLRSLGGASHLQTLTIPQFRTKAEPTVRKSSFSFRKKQKAPVSAGCDPTAFAEEIVAHLARAGEIRHRMANARPIRSVIVESSPASVVVFDQPAALIEPVVEDSWARAIEEPPVLQIEEPPVLQIEEPAVLEIEEPLMLQIEEPPVLEIEQPRVPEVPQSPVFEEDEVDRLVRQFGLDVKLVDIEEVREGAVDLASEIASVQAEAAAKLATELERVRADAEDRRLGELARVQAEADLTREIAIAEARAAAEREVRETLAVELARVRSEAEGTFADALKQVKVEAEEAERHHVQAQQAFADELTRVRAEVEQSLGVQLDRARAEAERVRAAEAEVARIRAEADAHLKSELERLRHDAERARQTERFQASKATEQIKEAAAVEARTVAEAATRRTLEAEIARVRTDADTLLETELARARAEAEQRQRADLEELRAQMAEMRTAAAEHARAAAAEAVASEVARAAAQSTQSGFGRELRTAVIARFPVNVIHEPDEPKDIEDSEEVEDEVAATPETTGPDARPDYYSLWQTESAPVEQSEKPAPPLPRSRPEFRRHAKWALPIAACLLLVTNTGTAISTVARLVSPSARPAATAVVEEKAPAPTVAVVPQKKLGELKVDSTPSGADVKVDGRDYGQTPVTIPDLAAGTHTLVLQSSAGTVTRRITIKAGGSVTASEAIFAGWLAIFSPIAIDLLLNGQPAYPTEDGRLMIAPGQYQLEAVSERFNFRSRATLEVRPGEVTAHTVVLPANPVRLNVPDGVEIRVDGQAIGLTPMPDLSMTVGTHEIVAAHPAMGERRATIDVRNGEVTDVTFAFEP